MARGTKAPPQDDSQSLLWCCRAWMTHARERHEWRCAHCRASIRCAALFASVGVGLERLANRFGLDFEDD